MRRTTAATVAFAGVLGIGLLALQQTAANPPKRADAAISGVITDAITKEPIPDALVQAGRMGPRDFPVSSQTQFTDAKGRFVFTDLPGGENYSLRALKSGFFPGAFGHHTPMGEARSLIRLADAQWFQSADFSLWKHGSLTGTVTDERGDPLIDVFVKILAEIHVAGVTHLASSPVTQTDDRGVYHVAGLPPGRYRVMVLSSPAAASPALMREAAANAAITGGMAAGPAIDVGGHSKVILGKFPVPPPPLNGRAFAYPITFAGGSSLAQATVVSLGAGEDVSGVDVRLAPVPALRLAGTVDGPAADREHLALRLLGEGLEELDIGSEAGTALVAPDGSFEFPSVPAGNYTIAVPLSINFFYIGYPDFFYSPKIPEPPSMHSFGLTGGMPPAAPPGIGFAAGNPRNRAWARAPVALADRDLTNVVVSLQGSVTMHGRLVGETDAAAPAPSDPPRFMTLESAMGDPSRGIPRPLINRSGDGTFTINGILPGSYVFQSSDNNGWIIKSVRVGGRDYTHAPIDLAAGTAYDDAVITFTNAIPSLTGAVRERSGAAAKDAAVIAFPVEPDQWQRYGLNPQRIRSTTASPDGAFLIRPLPAGDYYIVAVPAEQAAAWQEPGFFARVAGVATRVTIAWGQAKTIDVLMSGIR